MESIAYNYLCYMVPFYAGLHFRLLDEVPFLNKMFYAITWPPMVDAYGCAQFSLLGALAVVVLGIVAFLVFLYYQAGLLQIYLPLLLGIILLIGTLTFMLRRWYYLHLHHYFIFGVLAAFMPFQNIPVAMFQALLLGAAVEGVSTWGFDPVFVRRRRRQGNSEESHLQAHDEGQRQEDDQEPPREEGVPVQ